MEFSDMRKESDTDRVVEKRTLIECVKSKQDLVQDALPQASEELDQGEVQLRETSPDDVRRQVEEFKRDYVCDVTTKTYANSMVDYMRNRHVRAIPTHCVVIIDRQTDWFPSYTTSYISSHTLIILQLYAEGEPERETGVPFEQVVERYNIRVPSRGTSLDSLFVSPISTEHLQELQESFERTTRTLGRMLQDTWRLMDSYSLRDVEPIRKESRDSSSSEKEEEKE